MSAHSSLHFKYFSCQPFHRIFVDAQHYIDAEKNYEDHQHKQQYCSLYLSLIYAGQEGGAFDHTYYTFYPGVFQ